MILSFFMSLPLFLTSELLVFLKSSISGIVAVMTTETIITDKMVFGGDCIAKIGGASGKTVFVPYALPGEKLSVEIVEEHRDYCAARIVEILTPSPHRIAPFCPLYGTCGGCNLQHCDSSYQTELRSSILSDAFSREGISVPKIEVISGSPSAYRCRYQFHDGGLMAKAIKTVIPLENCPCAVPEINEWLARTPITDRPKGRVQVFASSHICSLPEGTPKILIAREMDALDEAKEKALKAKVQGKRKVKPRFAGTAPSPQNNCTVTLCGKPITFDIQGFFQSNMEVLEKTVPFVTGSIKGHHALDMYSGAGTFSAFLADSFDMVTLVEHNRDALVYAEQNLAGRKHESFGVSGEKWVQEHAASCIARNGPFDEVVVDPPRSGMEKAVCQWLCTSGIPHISSVSCDIATHARDAKFLLRAGYKLDRLFLLDFYPQTCHIESLALFEK